jgi:hypothetical protein
MRLWSTITLAIFTLLVILGGTALGGYGLQIKEKAANAETVTGVVKSFAYEETEGSYDIYPTVEYEVGDKQFSSSAPPFTATSIPYTEEGGPYDLEVHYLKGEPGVLVDNSGSQAQPWLYGAAGAAGLAFVLALIGIFRSNRKYIHV